MDLLMKKSSLFKQQKNAPAFLDGQEKLRLSLLKKLAEAIKEAQLLHATRKHNGAILDCRATQRLCARFENVLRHGLKGGWFGQATSFWPVVLKISRKQAIKYINSLQYAQSDSGRCRAWIRLAVNECSLESYISVLCQDDTLLAQYYETHSCLRNAETTSALKQLLAGLSQLTFNITVDTASLEFEAAPEALQPALRLDALQNTQRGKEHVKRSPEPGEEAGESLENSDGSVGSENEGSPVVESVKMKAHRSHSKAEPLLDHALQHTLQHEAPDTVNHDTMPVGNGPPDSLSGHGAPDSLSGHGTLDSLSGHGTVDSSSDQILKWSQADSALDDGSSISEKEGEEDRGKEEEEEEEKEKESKEEEEEAEKENKEEEEEAEKENKEEEDEEEEAEKENKEEEEEAERKEVREEADGSEGQGKEEEGMQYDQLKGECFLEENIDRSPSPVDSTIPAGSPSPHVETSHMPPVSDATQNFSFVEEPSTTTTHHEEPSTTTTHHEEPSTTATYQPSNPFDQDFESPDDNLYQLVPNPFDTLDEIDSICHDVTLKPAPTQENTPPNPFGSHSTDCSTSGDDPLGGGHLSGDRGLQYNDSLLKDSSLPGDTGLPEDRHLPDSLTRDDGLLGDRGLWENDSLPRDRGLPGDKGLPGDRDLPHDRKLLEEELVSNFAPDTTSYSSSLDLSCFLEATLDHSRFSETNSPHLQFQEDHFPPELSIADHCTIIQRLKDELASCPEERERGNLRRKIVQLQLRLQTMKENEVTESHEEICSHHFVRQPPQSRVLLGMMCEGCGKTVTGLIRTWYLCKVCHVPCHKSCLAGVSRMCVGSKEEGSYVTEICPEKGLTHQHFRCACCNRALNKQQIGARLCDYSGLYYCPACHKRDQAIIPARVLHNWDFTPRTVCCQCSDLLGRLFSRPLLRVQEANPLLYTYVQDLVTVEALRQNILHMKQYFVQCKAALEARLLQKLDPFPHFKEESCLFSLLELEALHTGRLLPELQEIHEIFAQHIRRDCPVCSGKGYFCEVCASEEVLFPFDQHVSSCQCCSTVYHKVCFSEKSCPKCYRLKKRHK